MLVLSRKRGQKVQLQDKVTGQVIGFVQVVRSGEQITRLGFELPDSIAILRDDIADEAPRKKRPTR